tara:strand:+ start:533 stop:1789 length:1257 start_codon:yes stop_codon:yes gene_type:complete
LKNKFSIYYISLLFIIINCSYYTKHGQTFRYAETAYKKNQLKKSFNQCIQSLEYNSSYYHSLLLIEKIIPEIVEKHHKKIELLKIRKKQFYWDRVVVELNELNDIVVSINKLNHKRSSYWLRISNTRDYKNELKIAKNKAALEHYNAGIKLLDRGNKKDAATHFKRTLEFEYNFLNAKELYENNKYVDNMQLLIFPFQLNDVPLKYHQELYNATSMLETSIYENQFFANSVNIIDFKNELIIENSINGKINIKDMLNIASDYDATHIIYGNISLLNISHPDYNKTTERFTHLNSIDYNVYFDENKIAQIAKTYGNIQAELTRHTIYGECELALNYSIVKTENPNELHSSTVNAVDKFLYEWGDFIGDERALNNKGRKLTRKKEVPPPTREYQLKITLEKLIKKLFKNSKEVLKEEVKS